MLRRATIALQERSSHGGAEAIARIGRVTLKRAALTVAVTRGEGSAFGRTLKASIGHELRADIDQAEFAMISRGIGASVEQGARSKQFWRIKVKVLYEGSDDPITNFSTFLTHTPLKIDF